MSFEHQALIAEIDELNAILASIPTERVIQRIAFQTRLDAATQALEKMKSQSLREKARLTFRGSPVEGSHGISADFGTKATWAFAEAFSAIVAGLKESLQYMGPIPDKDKNRLLITGTAVGSFGFEFELPESEASSDLFPETLKSEEALETLQDIFKVSAEGSDDEMTEVVDAIHPRALKKITEFLEYIEQHQALCGIEFRDRFFVYENIEQLQNSVNRLKEDNIHERDEEYFGELQGVLPKGRTFEFRVLEQNAIIKGKVDVSIEDPDVLNREWLHRPVSITFHVIQVGQGKPRYTLSNIQAIRHI